MSELLQILRSEIKPALGCTGPIGVCYCAAEAYDAIGGEIKKINAKVDWGVGCKIDDVAFPGTEYLGLEMAIAMGAVCGDASAGMEVLRTATPEGELKARKVAELVEADIQFGRDNMDVFIDIVIETDLGTGRAVVVGRSDGLVRKEKNGEVIFEKEPDAAGKSSPMLKYTIKDFYELAVNGPIEDIAFMQKSAEYNTALASETLKHNLGAGIGYNLYHSAPETDVYTRAKAWAAAGCEARMSGVNLPAMTCGNKGNVGVATSMPLVSMAKDLGKDDETLWRALAMSSLVAIAVIHRIGKSPAMCSCEVAASLGIAAGTIVLHGGTLEQVEIAIQNTVPSLFGCVCDGAKLACAMRISSGTGIAIEAATLALKGVRLAFNQGVLSTSADETINMLGRTASEGMIDSDRALAQELWAKRKIFPLMTFTDRQKQ